MTRTICKCGKILFLAPEEGRVSHEFPECAEFRAAVAACMPTSVERLDLIHKETGQVDKRGQA